MVHFHKNVTNVSMELTWQIVNESVSLGLHNVNESVSLGLHKVLSKWVGEFLSPLFTRTKKLEKWKTAYSG